MMKFSHNIGVWICGGISESHKTSGTNVCLPVKGIPFFWFCSPRHTRCTDQNHCGNFQQVVLLCLHYISSASIADWKASLQILKCCGKHHSPTSLLLCMICHSCRHSTRFAAMNLSRVSNCCTIHARISWWELVKATTILDLYLHSWSLIQNVVCLCKIQAAQLIHLHKEVCKEMHIFAMSETHPCMLIGSKLSSKCCKKGLGRQEYLTRLRLWHIGHTIPLEWDSLLWMAYLVSSNPYPFGSKSLALKVGQIAGLEVDPKTDT